jgi:hypothetical protein
MTLILSTYAGTRIRNIYSGHLRGPFCRNNINTKSETKINSPLIIRWPCTVMGNYIKRMIDSEFGQSKLNEDFLLHFFIS